MWVRRLRRVAFLAFVAQEVVVLLRATPEQRRQAPNPPLPALLGVCLLAPLLVALPLPRWVERLGLALQLLGWGLEGAAMAQLVRRGSFGIHPTAATQLAQGGLYRFEHPIYLGILLSLLGWTLPVPPSAVGVGLTYAALREAVRAERTHLASLQVRHRGLESALWPE